MAGQMTKSLGPSREASMPPLGMPYLPVSELQVLAFIVQVVGLQV